MNCEQAELYYLIYFRDSFYITYEVRAGLPDSRTRKEHRRKRGDVLPVWLTRSQALQQGNLCGADFILISAKNFPGL